MTNEELALVLTQLTGKLERVMERQDEFFAKYKDDRAEFKEHVISSFEFRNRVNIMWTLGRWLVLTVASIVVFLIKSWLEGKI